MPRLSVSGAVFWICAFTSALSAQAPAKVDFRRDVQPLFKTHCIDCHGPALQMNGFRLDRRRDAMKGGTLAMIGPGNSEGSRLYLRLIGNQYGMQMPPTGPLSKDKIEIIKAWIDQGAEWPDDVSGDARTAPADPKATRLMDALRQGDLPAFRKLLSADPSAAKLKGKGGSTALMYAALYGNSESMRLLLQSGADARARNDAGATALMWAIGDAEKTRLLLDAGADANARSEDGRSPLIIAAGTYGTSAVVKLLLDHGADPNAKSAGLFGEITPLSEAAHAGDDGVFEMLAARGADLKAAGPLALYYALQFQCAKCAQMISKSAPKEILNVAMFLSSPPLGDATSLKFLLDRGGDAKAKDPAGRSILMLAASSDALPVDSIRTLLSGGADVNDKSAEGKSALDCARQRGQTSIVDLLLHAGAKDGGAAAMPAGKPQPAGSARAALERTIPLLQHNDVTFIRKSGCVSCHNNTLTAMSIAAARKHGLRVDEQVARKQLQTIATYMDGWRERALQAKGIPGDADTISYILLGMAAENYPADETTDAFAYYLKARQMRDGRWRILAHRPPLESSDFQVTAASLRAIQIYAPKPQRAEYEKAIRQGAEWLAKAQPRTTEDRAFQLLGLAWAGGGKEAIRKAAHDLIAEQRPDGGWAQIPSLASDAYATGQALAALKESGTALTDPAYKRGAKFLLDTQLADGSWHVRTRAIPIQPHFESDFPHGRDQFISASATNWAAMALAPLAR